MADAKNTPEHVDEVHSSVPVAPKTGEWYVKYPNGIAVLLDQGKDKEATRLVLPVGAALPKDVSVDEIDRLAAVGFIAVKG